MTKVGIIIFPGSNCDQDMIYILETVLKQELFGTKTLSYLTT